MPSGIPEPLKLVALDYEDLKIISAHLQDAVLRMADMAYMPAEQRFAAILSRFDWLAAEKESCDAWASCGGWTCGVKVSREASACAAVSERPWAFASAKAGSPNWLRTTTTMRS